MRRESIGVGVAASMKQKMLATAEAFDIDKNGLYDRNADTVSIWCSPDDRPKCWNVPITCGALEYPREWVGELHFEDMGQERFTLVIHADPNELVKRRKRKELTVREWKLVMDWLREKALGLVRLAQLAPKVIGTQCPFCVWVLPVGKLLNELLDHVAAAHPVLTIHGLNLGTPPLLRTSAGDFELRDAEQFD